MAIIPVKKLDFWINNNCNVLFIGTHGLGKTAIVKETFERHKLKWKYFSAATMDPWVDFIGVPKEKTDENGSYLELIRPAEFRDDAVEMLFFDEFNRASPKVRNAVMELIQFKSINGRKFNNLRAVWAAINPYDENETYNVEQLDPAQQDRFHVIYTLPTEPDEQYFISKYGDTIGTRATGWWRALPDTSRVLVSPRRLDYAVDMYTKGGDLEDVLDSAVRPKTLKKMLERISDDENSTDRWLTDPDTFLMEIKVRNSKVNVVEAFGALCDLSLDQAMAYIPDLPAPHLTKLASSNQTVYAVLRSIQGASERRKLQTAIKTIKVNEEDLARIIREQSLVSSKFYNILSKCEKSPAVSENWALLATYIQSQPTPLSHGDRILAMMSCTNRLKTFDDPSSNPNKLIRTAAKCVQLLIDQENATTKELVTLISVNPSIIADCYQNYPVVV